MQINTKLDLNDGQEMPMFGLGVYLTNDGDECFQAVSWALDVGYRLIDTAAFYENENSVGKAIKASEIDRSEIFVTTKLWNSDHGYDNCLRAFDKSIKALGLEYVDLYLVHYPVAEKRLDTWRAMEKLSKDERCRSVGVSNYLHRHLEELMDNSDLPPAVNQIELSPYSFQSRRKTVDLCRQNNIVLQAYSPLVRGRRFDDPKLIAMAEKYEKTPAQILIRWAMQEKMSVIPKSSNRERILENADVFYFEISDGDMQALRDFDENFIVCWDPAETA